MRLPAPSLGRCSPPSRWPAIVQQIHHEGCHVLNCTIIPAQAAAGSWAVVDIEGQTARLILSAAIEISNVRCQCGRQLPGYLFLRVGFNRLRALPLPILGAVVSRVGSMERFCSDQLGDIDEENRPRLPPPARVECASLGQPSHQRSRRTGKDAYSVRA